jgi:plastocyanin
MLFEVHALAPADFDAWLKAKIAEAKATPPPPPSGDAGVTLELSALNIAYEQTSLTAPADAPFQIEFDNKDSGVPHNVAIHKDSPAGEEVFKGDIFSGPGKRTYRVPPLPAGAYAFACTVHPNMSGTLTVQ